MKGDKLRGLLVEWFKGEKILGEKEIEVLNFKFQIPNVKPNSKKKKLSEYYENVQGCKKCGLHMGRNNLVFGEGSLDSGLVFVGEAPGREEDIAGRPFVGEAGKLLTKLIEGVGLRREDVYITNIVKCRPPGNRDPTNDEIKMCLPWLIGQLEIIAPRIICCLGRWSAWALIGRTHGFATTSGFSKIRGKVYDFNGIKVVPTYHPAALLYHPGWREAVETDLRLIIKNLKT